MRKTFGKFIIAAVVYIALAVYLYQPYFSSFKKLQFLVPANVCLACLGSFALSRRWVPGFLGSLFAGAIYGFGPFMLGLAAYHPTAGFLAAMMPWLFLPAAFGPKGKWQWLRVPLVVLPFLAILLFFGTSSHYRLFAVPMQTRLHLADLTGLAAPFVATRQNINMVGFYHILIAALVMGFAITLAARRLSVLIIFCLGAILASCRPLLGVSPIIWLSISVLCCSVIIGAGLQGLCSAGLADRKWILLSMAFMAALAIATLLQATKYFQVFMGFGDEYANLFLADAKMFIAGAVALLAVFFIARAKLRLAWLRWGLLSSATAVDIFFCARFVVDMMF
ncbi:MAG: hypothetical protein JW947_03195 [Sedimentisphaerales bacterium]|nr:hypothetical protein [Sedimentisphaerales bacterium]